MEPIYVSSVQDDDNIIIPVVSADAAPSTTDISSMLLLMKTQADLRMVSAVGNSAPMAASVDPNAWPDNNDPDLPDDIFNLNVPTDPLKAIEKLEAMLNWAIYHLGNKKTMTAILNYTSELAAQGTFAAVQKIDLTAYNQLMDQVTKVYEKMIDFQISLKIYELQQDQTNGPTPELMTFYQSILLKFQGNDPISIAIQNRVKDWADTSSKTWTSFLEENFTNGHINHSYDGYQIIINGNWGAEISTDSAKDAVHTIRMMGMDQLMLLAKTNPMLALMLAIEYLFGGYNDDATDQCTGYGDTGKDLQSYITRLTKLQNEWTAGFTDDADGEKSAQAFVEAINNLKFDIDHSPVLSDSDKAQLDSDLNTGILQVQIPSGGTAPDETIEQFYEDDKNSPGVFCLAKALHNLIPDGKTTPNQAYQNITNSVKAALVTGTSTSQATTTMLSQITSSFSANLKLFSSILNESIAGLLSKAVQNQVVQ